jgi:hypothetical protein
MEAPKYPQSVGTERELLEAHIEFCRQTVIYKVTGVTKADGIKRLGPTATSVLGLLRHLTEVEYWWFQDRFVGDPYTDSRSSESEPDGEFIIAEGDTVESLLQGYKDACENSRKISLGRSLDDVAVHPRPRDDMQPSLRWIYLHLIDETARHAGHLDIYRELLDGAHDGLPFN